MKIEPCPFCGGECVVHPWGNVPPPDEFQVVCMKCPYATPTRETADEIQAAHNRVARAVQGVEQMRGDLKMAQASLATLAQADDVLRRLKGGEDE